MISFELSTGETVQLRGTEPVQQYEADVDAVRVMDASVAVIGAVCWVPALRKYGKRVSVA